MKAIESYVNKFLHTHKMSAYYAIRLDEAFTCIQAVKEAPVQTINTILVMVMRKGIGRQWLKLRKGDMSSNTQMDCETANL